MSEIVCKRWGAPLVLALVMFSSLLASFVWLGKPVAGQRNEISPMRWTADRADSFLHTGYRSLAQGEEPSCREPAGVVVDPMESVGDWHTGMGNGAVSAALTTVAGFSGQAIRMSYDLGEAPGAWVQFRRDFDPPLNIAGDHLRIFYQGTATNTLEIGLVSATGENYFATPWNQVTHVPWWTYATWDLQGFRKDGEPFPDFTQVKAIFISVVKQDEGDVGGLGSLSIDELQYLNVATRTVPSAFEQITADLSVAQRAAESVAAQQQPGGLLKSWQEETADYAWLYIQALGLIVLSETNLADAQKLASKLHELQLQNEDEDGSWYTGYHYLTSQPIDDALPIGANAWAVYALARYALKASVHATYQDSARTAYQDALRGAAWLAGLQRLDGSLPAVAGEANAPTEPNLGAWWAFQATGHQPQADLLKNFLLGQVWDSNMGRFKSSPNTYQIFLDNATWGASFLQAIGEDEKARQALSYARWTLATPSASGVCGFDGAGPFSVWNEGTLQYVAAHGEGSKFYWEEMVSQQAPDGGLTGSPDNFQSDIVWLTRMHGIAPSSWLYFAGTDGPFDIPVFAAPHAVITASLTRGSAPLAVTFANGSTGIYTSSLWAFGDGATSTQSNPTHTYTLPGVYTVTLTVTGPGGTDVMQRPDYITVERATNTLSDIYLPTISR